MAENRLDSRRIVVVGPCASGKSTLVTALRLFGYDAQVSAQEHSEIASLWQHTQPDILVALNVDLAAIRRRRGQDWPSWLHDLQHKRLRAAAEAADLTVDTTKLDQQAVFDRVVAFLQSSR
jgi:ATPase subunit of ABC transporter with duplicated ATPase domains